MDIRVADVEDPVAIALLKELSDTLARITGDSGAASFDLADTKLPGALFVIGFDDDRRPVGCGAYRPLQDGIAEIKRMFASPGSKGLGKAILTFLEQSAAKHGYQELWLETRIVNTRAVSFYERNGYQRIPNFGKYVGRPEAVCFAKRLVA